MGRKGGGGGTAGGGRSGSRGNVTYSRVVPKFLQKLADPESMKNPLDAKRPSATGHLQERQPPCERIEKSSEPSERVGPKDEVNLLEAQGFNVVAECEVNAHMTEKDEKETDSDLGKRKVARGNDGKLLRLRGIEKKTKHATSAAVRKAFHVKDRQKLSFADSSSDSEDE